MIDYELANLLEAYRQGTLDEDGLQLLREAGLVHTVRNTCGHVRTYRCDPGCQHGSDVTDSITRCPDCIWRF